MAQSLSRRIDLIVITPCRKRQKFGQIDLSPRRMLGQMDLPCFKARSLRKQAGHLVKACAIEDGT